MIPVTVSDPERECIAVLNAAVPGIASTDYPSTTLSGDARKVQVDLEGGDTSDYPAVDRAQVRITCHRAAGKRTDVKADADEMRRHLASYGGSSTVAAIWPGARSGVSVDPATRNLMCWFLARVDLKATTVAS